MSLIATGVPVTQGTWTPSVAGNATYTLQYGVYTKIGRMVTIHGRVTIDVLGTGNAYTIAGLPFPVVTDGRMGVQVHYFQTSASNFTFMAGTIVGSSINLTSLTAAAATMGNNTFFGNAASIIFSGTYLTS